MSDVLAVVVEGRHAQELSDVGTAMAGLLRGRLRVLDVPAAAGAEETASRVLEALAAPAISLAVLATATDEEAASWRVMQRATKPLVLVPPDARLAHATIGRVLVPLDGTVESSHAVAHACDLCSRAGVDVVVLHVLDPSTAPRYWDQPAHAARAWTEEFLSRHVAAPSARVELRRGAPDENVLDVADELGADLIALGWSQHLDEGHARTVRRSVLDARVPVMLVGVDDVAHPAARAPAGTFVPS